MSPDYILLSNGIKYRVEANFNSLISFCKQSGITDLSQLDGIANIQIDKVPALIHSCIAEGERMDGRTLTLSEQDLTAMFRTVTVGEFFKIYAAQSQAAPIAVANQQKKRTFPRLWPRRR